jgi:pre-mRNA-splicing factor ATP-dependent RNA helicase DHX15/PRP43
MKRKLDIGSVSKRSNPYMSGGGAGTGNDSTAGENVSPYTGRTYTQRYWQILEGRKKLPVYEFLDALVDKMRETQVLVVEGETGSGKTTQVFSSFKCGPFPNLLG